MKRNYRDLNITDRRAQAGEEAFFDMPDGTHRLECLAALAGRIERASTPDRLVRWLTDRGISPENVLVIAANHT